MRLVRPLDVVTTEENILLLGRPAPERPTWQPGLRSAPARPVIESGSPPPLIGSAPPYAHHAAKLQAEALPARPYSQQLVEAG